MKVGRTLYVTNRKRWRAWLRKNHRSAGEIWLVYYTKDSGKPRIPYNDAVEEALCYGWIDSTMKSLGGGKFVQRFTPRRPGSELSELNRERLRRLLKAKKMTRFGLEKVEHAFREHRTKRRERFRVPADLEKALRRDPLVWKHFRAFSESYRRIRIGWLVASQRRPEIFRKRLRYFLRMTAKNRRFGMLR